MLQVRTGEHAPRRWLKLEVIFICFGALAVPYLTVLRSTPAFMNGKRGVTIRVRTRTLVAFREGWKENFRLRDNERASRFDRRRDMSRDIRSRNGALSPEVDVSGRPASLSWPVRPRPWPSS